MFDFTQAISGFVFFLIIIFLVPTLLINGFAKMSGAKVRLPAVMKPVLKGIIDFTGVLLAIADMVAQVVAELVAKWLPPKYAHCRQFFALCIKLLIIGISAMFFLRFLCVLAER